MDVEMFYLGQKLYGVTSNKNIKTWWCDVTPDPYDEINGPATITICNQTKLGGKVIERQEVIREGKNLGKSNETSPYEQAVSEAESRYRRQIKKGYSVNIPTDTSKADSNSLGLPKPMLARPIDKVATVEFPAHVQPKLDGYRALVTKRNGRTLMYSRGGDEITTMGHILEHLDDKLKEGQTIDGELYVHGEILQNIGSLIRREQEDSKRVNYHVYDMMMDAPYGERWGALRLLIPTQEGPVKHVSTQIVHDLAEAMKFRDTVIELGYEGAMLRIPDSGYEAGKKSKKLLKLKQFDDSEHLIVDVVEGKDRDVNGTQLKVAIFICQTPEGQTFDCTAMGDMYEKDRTWHEREKYIGRQLTVQHSGYTKEGKPWHPVALRLREDI